MIDLSYMDLEPYLSDIGDSGSDSCSSEIRNILTDFDSDYVSLGEDNSVMPMLCTHNYYNKMPIKSESVNSNFNTDDFPTNLEDIDWGLIEMEDSASTVLLPSQQPLVTQELVVPVIEVTEVPLEATLVPECQSPTSTNSDKDDDDDESEDDGDNNRLTLPPRKSRQRSGGSTTSSSSSLDSESDREWRPEEEQQERPRLPPASRRRRGAARGPGAGARRDRRDSVRKHKSSSHRPTPQRRAPGIQILLIRSW
jgi:hypothetical protein